jgi:hypothetical protein
MAKNDETVFVNPDKERRARDIVALATGKRAPARQSEIEVKAYWAQQLDGEKGDLVLFVYGKLGGLTRTLSEQKDADRKKAEIKAKGKGKAKK